MAIKPFVGCGEVRTAPFTDPGRWCGSFVTTPYRLYRQMEELEKLDGVIRENLAGLGYGG
ncbi:hypothetical protein DJ031_07530 [bacterium endosymbiont of Escarpia laminata]|nr:MAG: hypothetical protein DJ031_07530 [bacterium endosymbiont of Escarpia laminata]